MPLAITKSSDALHSNFAIHCMALASPAFDYTALECGPRLKRFKSDLEDAIKGALCTFLADDPLSHIRVYNPRIAHSFPACSMELSPVASRGAFKTLENIMRIIVTAINHAAPRSSDLYVFIRRDCPSNVGRKVVLTGLVSRQDLNGCYATIIDEPRYASSIDRLLNCPFTLELLSCL
jgi:hypothetical protein